MAVNVRKELIVGNVIDCFEKWKEEPECECTMSISIIAAVLCVCVQMCSLKAENMEREKNHRTKAHTQQRQFTDLKN